MIEGVGPSNGPNLPPRTLREVNLSGRIRVSGMLSLKEAGDFFGWEPSRITKGVEELTKSQLLTNGWTKERLITLAEGYEHVVRLTPDNSSAAGRAAQLRELAGLWE